MNTIQKTALILTIFGAINWGLVGIFSFDLIATIARGSNTLLASAIYTLVGLCGIINLMLLFSDNDL